MRVVTETVMDYKVAIKLVLNHPLDDPISYYYTQGISLFWFAKYIIYFFKSDAFFFCHLSLKSFLRVRVCVLYQSLSNQVRSTQLLIIADSHVVSQPSAIVCSPYRWCYGRHDKEVIIKIEETSFRSGSKSAPTLGSRGLPARITALPNYCESAWYMN